MQLSGLLMRDKGPKDDETIDELRRSAVSDRKEAGGNQVLGPLECSPRPAGKVEATCPPRGD